MPQMKSVAVKLPDSAIKELKAIADAQYIPTRTMIRAWIMQRLNAELGRDNGTQPPENHTLIQYHFKTFTTGSSQKHFKEDVLIDVLFENGRYIGSNDDLGLLVAAPSVKEMSEGIEEEFGILWSEYVQADVSTLTDGARKFRADLLELVE